MAQLVTGGIDIKTNRNRVSRYRGKKWTREASRSPTRYMGINGGSPKILRASFGNYHLDLFALALCLRELLAQRLVTQFA